MQSTLLRLLLKATNVATEHPNCLKLAKNSIIKPIFHNNKNTKLQLKMDLQQSSICSDQNINPSPDKFYTSAARTACNI